MAIAKNVGNSEITTSGYTSYKDWVKDSPWATQAAMADVYKQNGDIDSFLNLHDQYYKQSRCAWKDYQNNGATQTKELKFSDEDKTAITAANEGEVSEQASAAASAQSALNSGINKAAAGLLGSTAASGTTSTTANNMYGMLGSQQAQTQADYLDKLGQAKGAECMASNMKTANLLNSFAALLGA